MGRRPGGDVCAGERNAALVGAEGVAEADGDDGGTGSVPGNWSHLLRNEAVQIKVIIARYERSRTTREITDTEADVSSDKPPFINEIKLPSIIPACCGSFRCQLARHLLS